MEFWGPRLGASGAFRFSLYVWASFLVKPVALVAFVSLLVAGTGHGTTAQIVAIAFLVLAFVLALGMLMMPVLARRAASRELGVRVTIKNYPPRDEVEYRNWCTRNGIEPFRSGYVTKH
jgi:hypothetical protein